MPQKKRAKMMADLEARKAARAGGGVPYAGGRLLGGDAQLVVRGRRRARPLDTDGGAAPYACAVGLARVRRRG